MAHVSEEDHRIANLPARRGVTLAGVPLQVSPWWIAIFVVLGVWGWTPASTALPGQPLAAACVAFVYPASLFVSVLLHEISHAVVGRRNGQPPTVIAITLLGGHTQFGAEAPTPKALFKVAGVGPLTNIVLALLGFAGYVAVSGHNVAETLFFAVAVTNMLVAVLNLIPGLPLDGGQMLAAVVWGCTGSRERGVLVGAWGGVVFGGLIAAYGLIALVGPVPQPFSGMWFLFIGAVIGSQAFGLVRSVRLRNKVDSLVVSDVMRPARELQITVRAHHAAALVDDGLAVVVMSDDVVIGVVDVAALVAVPPEQLPLLNISAITETVPTHTPVPASLAGIVVLQTLQQFGGTHWAVADEGGHIVGVLHASDLESRLSS